MHQALNLSKNFPDTPAARLAMSRGKMLARRHAETPKPPGKTHKTRPTGAHLTIFFLTKRTHSRRCPLSASGCNEDATESASLETASDKPTHEFRRLRAHACEFIFLKIFSAPLRISRPRQSRCSPAT